jgi:hypothetical protein
VGGVNVPPETIAGMVRGAIGSVPSFESSWPR